MPPLFAQPGQPGQCLQRLAQAHVVGQHAAKAVRGEIRQKMKSFGLVRAHLGANGRRQPGRDTRLQFAHAPPDIFNTFGREESLRGVIGQLQRVKPLRFGREIPRVEANPGELLVLLGREVVLEPPPAFFAKPHVPAARVEQEFQFLRCKLGVAHIERDLQIEPVHAGLGDVE
jgi:hypothetical protein